MECQLLQHSMQSAKDSMLQPPLFMHLPPFLSFHQSCNTVTPSPHPPFLPRLPFLRLQLPLTSRALSNLIPVSVTLVLPKAITALLADSLRNLLSTSFVTLKTDEEYEAINWTPHHRAP